MNASFSQLIIFLLAGIVSIILLTVKFRVHPFFALIIACFVTGLGVQLPFAEILSLIKNGFGESKMACVLSNSGDPETKKFVISRLAFNSIVIVSPIAALITPFAGK